MNDRAECNYCEISIDRLKAEGRGWTKLISRVPLYHVLNHLEATGYMTVVFYYCDKCWHQQQSRMFG